MILNFGKSKPQETASASVVDGKLILSLPDALTPIVWQMDLAHAKASALEVREKTKGKKYTLTLKTPKGEIVEVAEFDNRDNAVTGLMAASNALKSAHGQIRTSATETNQNAPANDTPTVKSKPKTTPEIRRKKWLGAILGLVILFILFSIWSSVVPLSVDASGEFAATSASANPQSTSGVPVSADAFLSGN